MTVTIPTSEAQYGYVVGRVIRALGDTTDADDKPDAVAAVGSVSFTPKATLGRTTDYSAFIVREKLTAPLDAQGNLVRYEGATPAGIALTVGAYRVDFTLNGGNIPGFEIEVTAAHTEAAPLDLVTAAPYVPPSGVTVNTMLVPAGAAIGQVLAWSASGLDWVDMVGGGGGGAVSSVAGRTGAVVLSSADLTDFTEATQDIVGAMVTGAGGTYDDAAGTITLPGGGSSTITADDTPAAPAEGSSASYLVTSAVTWPAGLVWSTDPDGGVAPTITGTALVSLFTVGGVTRAIMGATFSGVVVPDTTAPVAGTLAVVPSSTSALGTVTGASDTEALGAVPYSFRLDAGAWSAWQASATYTWTGLTASTTYTFQHRARDAAGNTTVGTAVTGTTDAPSGDSTSPTVGSMTASSITATGFTVTVSGASDETALGAAPYAFTTDGGSTWSAYQASPVYVASGLTAETGYSCNWRVRDAAGNISTGTAQTVTTAAPPAAVADSFNRADSTTTLGSADTGQVWTYANSVVWGISSNAAYRVTPVGQRGFAAVPYGALDMKVQATLAATGSTTEDTQYPSVVARYTDADNNYVFQMGGGKYLLRRLGGTQTLLVTISETGTYPAGSVCAITTTEEATGTRIVGTVDGVVVADYLDETSPRPLGTGAGLALWRNGTARLDDFSVVAP